MAEGVPERSRLLGVLDGFSRQRVVVVGDLSLDHYLFGDAGRISREYPVVILTHRHEEFRPGGAANTVANIASLGAQAVPIGWIGDDAGGDELVKLLGSMGCPTDAVVRDARATTVTKTRIVADGGHGGAPGQHHLLRVDRLGRGEPREEAVDALVSAVGRAGDLAGGFILSDYGGGTLASPVAGAVLGGADGRYVGLDSRHRLLAYPGVTAATPNLEEAGEACGRDLSDLSDEAGIEAAGRDLRGSLGAEALLITRGSAGMSLFEPGAEPAHIPVAKASEVFDVTGAGDTVVAAFTLARLAGATFFEAAYLANLAGGLSVRHPGATPVPLADLREAVGETTP